jgi:hypothetical protein
MGRSGTAQVPEKGPEESGFRGDRRTSESGKIQDGDIPKRRASRWGPRHTVFITAQNNEQVDQRKGKLMATQRKARMIVS